jgi:hypothetical protein
VSYNQLIDMDQSSKPAYQKAYQYIAFFLIGMLSLGGALSALRNAAALISVWTAWIFTAVAIIGGVGFQIYLTKRPLRWVLEDGMVIYIKRLGHKPIIGLLGSIGLVWLGSAMHVTPDVSGPILTLSLADSLLMEGASHEVFYAMPSAVKQVAFRGTYLPLYVGNSGTKSAENVSVKLVYSSSPRISVTQPARQETLGIKEQQQIRRRTETFEGTDFTFIAIDEIGPKQQFVLNEPIELPVFLLESPRGAAGVTLEMSARDLIPSVFHVDVRCVTAGSLEEAELAIKTLIWARAVDARRRMGFLAYLGFSYQSERTSVTIVVPQFRVTESATRGRGFQSDAMHDKAGEASYEPAPLKYLFAPLFN